MLPTRAYPLPLFFSSSWILLLVHLSCQILTVMLFLRRHRVREIFRPHTQISLIPDPSSPYGRRHHVLRCSGAVRD
ncbi:hypothetical protein EDB83DRAFT_2404827 [Lactarius deliciosus]|nr:hypothetical protein EDB83DRAFT_2404827 [Lactarius deliciosus]